jgi:hypothetical protein
MTRIQKEIETGIGIVPVVTIGTDTTGPIDTTGTAIVTDTETETIGATARGIEMHTVETANVGYREVLADAVQIAEAAALSRKVLLETPVVARHRLKRNTRQLLLLHALVMASQRAMEMLLSSGRRPTLLA